jgi:hypothetical protein
MECNTYCLFWAENRMVGRYTWEYNGTVVSWLLWLIQLAWCWPVETVNCPQLSDAIRILTGIWSKVTTLAFLRQVLVSQTTLLELLDLYQISGSRSQCYYLENYQTEKCLSLNNVKCINVMKVKLLFVMLIKLLTHDIKSDVSKSNMSTSVLTDM